MRHALQKSFKLSILLSTGLHAEILLTLLVYREGAPHSLDESF